MAFTTFILKALRYAHADGFNPEDYEAVRELVLWLENTKVRRYPIDGRGALQAGDAAAWEAGFRQYLVDLECPIALEAGNRQPVLQWLLTHAGASLQAASHATFLSLAGSPLIRVSEAAYYLFCSGTRVSRQRRGLQSSRRRRHRCRAAA